MSEYAGIIKSVSQARHSFAMLVFAILLFALPVMFGAAEHLLELTLYAACFMGVISAGMAIYAKKKETEAKGVPISPLVDAICRELLEGGATKQELISSKYSGFSKSKVADLHGVINQFAQKRGRDMGIVEKRGDKYYYTGTGSDATVFHDDTMS